MSKISSAWFHRLKAAQRDLISQAGGIERAAELTSMSKSQVGRWNNPGDAEIMTVPAALLLEADASNPLFTAVMAGLHNRRLSDPDDDRQAQGNVLSKHAETIRAASELLSVGAMAYVDGRLTPAEAQGLDRAASAMERATAELRKALAGARESGFSVIEGGGR